MKYPNDMMFCPTHDLKYLKIHGCEKCQYNCKDCDLEFKNLEELEQHARESHKDLIFFTNNYKISDDPQFLEDVKPKIELI